MTCGKKENKSKFSSWGFPSSCSKWKKSSLPTKKSPNPPQKWGKPTVKKFEPIKTLNTKNVSQVSATTWDNYGLIEKVYLQVSFDRCFYLQHIFVF